MRVFSKVSGQLFGRDRLFDREITLVQICQILTLRFVFPVSSELLTYTQEPWSIADFPDMGADQNLSAFCDDACDPTG
jgi:hypothetical protein